MYLDHLTFCVAYINGRRYVSCSECYGVSNECVQPIGAHGGKVMHVLSGWRMSQCMYFM